MSDEEYKIETPKSKGATSIVAKVFFGLGAAVLIAIFAYPVFVPESEPPVETSQAQEFQESEGGGAFARIETESQPASDPVDFSRIDEALANQQTEAEERNLAFLEQVTKLEQELNDLRTNTDTDEGQVSQEIAQAIADANKANAEMLTGIQEDFRTQITALQDQNQALQERLEAQNLASLELQNRMTTDMELQRIEEEKSRLQAELQAEQKLEQEELLIRTRSPSVVFDESGQSSSSPSGLNESGSGNASRANSPNSAERNLAFIEAGAQAVAVTNSEFIANPSKTIIQGTMIGATLENAINSSLPGNVIATVNEPVWSFDGAEVLIQPGSRVFGSYSSDVELGQGRILVRWSRIVTPEGQSVQISAFGGDEQGRSGVTGRVNTRFAARFGGAALISVIGAVPTLVAEELNDDSEVAQDTAENIADNFNFTTSAILNEYATLPPIISVEPGAQVSILVDRDLEFF